jgi:hypothetical protein
MASLTFAGALAAAPTWTPAHTVSGSAVAAGEPAALLFGGPSAQGYTATAAWAAWEAGGVINAAERPAELGAWAPAVSISDAGGGASHLEAGPDVAVWQRAIGEDTIVQAAIRTNGVWAPAEDLSPPGADATDPNVGAIFALQPVVAWIRADGGNPVVQAAVRSAQPGATWGDAVTLSDPGAAASQVDVAARGRGVIAVWRSQEGAESRIRFAVYSRDTGLWSTPFVMSPLGETASEPRVATTSEGVTVILWVAGTGPAATIRAATLPEDAIEPTAPTTLSGPGASEPRIATSRNTVAAWRRVDGSDEMIEAAIRSRDSGAWSAPERLSPEGERADQPAVAAGAVFRRFEEGVAPFDTAFQVAWTRLGDAGTAVLAASRPEGIGDWGDPQEIAPAGGPVEGLRLAEGNGETLALWRRSGGPVEAAAYDTVGPLFSDLRVEPVEPRVGQAVHFSVTPYDTWSPVTSVEWHDGLGTATGLTHDRVYANPGRFPVRLVVSDANGNSSNLVTFDVRPFEYPAPQAPLSSQVVCARPAAPAKGKPTGRIELSARQLLVSQRIAQAAVRRANAIERWLDAGIETRDICGAAFGTAAFTGITDAVGGGGPIPKPAPNPRPLDERAPAGARAGRVALTSGQLLVNQRIAQAALRRLGALETRLRAGLTGGDLRDGAITAGQLAPGLEIRAITPPATPTPPSVTPPSDPPKGGKAERIALTAAQLRINQRIAQAAVRRANALRLILMTGLQAGHFRPGTIDASKLDPALRTS